MFFGLIVVELDLQHEALPVEEELLSGKMTMF